VNIVTGRHSSILISQKTTPTYSTGPTKRVNKVQSTKNYFLGFMVNIN